MMEDECSFHVNSWMVDSILMMLIEGTVATEYANIGPKWMPYIASSLVIFFMTLLQKQT